MDPRALWQTAIACLARREHTRLELQHKLQARHCAAEPSLIQGVIDELEHQGYQSDVRFTEAWVRHRRGQGHGPLRVREELRARGVATDLIDGFVQPADLAWQESLQRQIQRRIKSQGLTLGGAEHRRVLAALQRRGFGTGLIQAALREYLRPA